MEKQGVEIEDVIKLGMGLVEGKLISKEAGTNMILEYIKQNCITKEMLDGDLTFGNIDKIKKIGNFKVRLEGTAINFIKNIKLN